MPRAVEPLILQSVLGCLHLGRQPLHFTPLEFGRNINIIGAMVEGML